jgi:hypothetical protein
LPPKGVDLPRPSCIQIVLGRGRPNTTGYSDSELHKRRDVRLEAV